MDLQNLKTIPLFSSLSDQQLALLHPHLQQRSYARSSCVVREGQQTDAIYVILSGHVKVSMRNDEGKEVILAKIGPSEFFGEMGLFDPKARSNSVETIERSDILRVSHSGFKACLKDNFDLASVLIRNLVGRLREADRKIGTLALLDVTGRVSRLFVDHAQEINGAWVVQSAPPKEEIARMVGASREMISRVVKQLGQRGYIRYEKRKVFLLDLAKLGGAL